MGKGLALLLQKLIDNIESLDIISIKGFHRILKNAEFDSEWIRAQIPDPLPKDTYHRRLLHAGKDYEIVLATWPVGCMTLAHNHGSLSSKGMVRVIRGKIFNRIYRVVDGETLTPVKDHVVGENEMIPVPEGLVHTMGNASDNEIAMSLHFYSPIIIDVTYWDNQTLKKMRSHPA